MRIYLDWNIIVDLYEQKHKELQSALANRNSNIITPFSSVHLKEGQKYNDDNREKDILNFISQITKNQFLYIDPLDTKIIELHPNFVNSYERIKNEFFTLNSNIMYAELIDISKLIGFNNQKLNNYDYKLIIKKIDEIIGKQEVGDKFRLALNNNVSFNNLIDVLINFMKAFLINKLSFTKNIFTQKYIYEMKIQYSLSLLNLLGYWQERNNKIRSFDLDAYHSVYASYCDYFITNDKKLFNKVLAVYYNLDVKTEIIFLKQEFHKVLKLLSI